jgi:putative membrane protein
MRRTASLTVAALGAVPALTPRWVFAQQTPESNTYHLGSRILDFDGMIFGLLLIILALTMVIAVALALVRGFGGASQQMPPATYPPARTAIDILKERYARGEIDSKEFEERRKVLGD